MAIYQPLVYRLAKTKGLQHAEPGRFRRRWDAAFARFRDHWFRSLVTWAVNNRFAMIAIALAFVIVLFGLLRGGRIGFSFFPNVEGSVVVASVTFVAGTPPERVKSFVDEVEDALYGTDQALGGGLVRVANVATGRGFFSNGRKSQTGDQFASVTVELIPSDEREVRNEAFIAEWESRLRMPPGLVGSASSRSRHPRWSTPR